MAANASDANLTRWSKGGSLVTIPEVVLNSSRAMMVDPVPSWRGADGTWRMIAACNTLRACMWKAPTAMGPFTFVGGFGNTDTNHTGSFECPDFWRVPQTDTYVLSTMGEGWAVGSYLPNANDSVSDVFTPLHGKNVGSQLDQMFDYGSTASSAHRTFFDTKHGRHVLWGSVGGFCKGGDWQGVMSFPRVVGLDPLDDGRLVSSPLPEISSLWANTSTITSSFEVEAGATHRLPASFGGNQLDLTFGFDANASAPRTFGVRVLAAPGTEVTRGVNVTVSTTPGSAFAALGGGAVSAARANSPASLSRTDFRVSGATLDLRILVDHALVEVFAEGGRSAATAWLCASPEDIGVEIVNLGPGTLVVKGVTAHTVASVNRLPWEQEPAAADAALKTDDEGGDPNMFSPVDGKTDDDSGSSGEVMNATDLRMPTLIDFNLKKPVTDAQGIAACSAYCAKQSSTCGGWVRLNKTASWSLRRPLLTALLHACWLYRGASRS